MKKARGSNNNGKESYSISAKTAYAILMMIGMPIVLALSAIAASPFPAIQLVYGQGTPRGEQQQQELSTMNFQTTNVTLDGVSYPVKYNITDNAAEVLSMAPDRDSFKLVTTIAPTKDGKLTLMIPRNLTDFKVEGGKDGKFVVNINAKPITNFQEISNNQTTRGLEVNFGKNDRVIEIVGTQMGQADISKVKEQATQATPTAGSNASEAANASKTGGSIVNQTGEAGANASKTGGSIVNQTGEAVQTFVNKTTGVLGNITGEILGK